LWKNIVLKTYLKKKKGKGKFRRFASPGKWKENFSNDEKEVMNNILKDTLQKMGYDE